jgi:hypothetical protein
MIIQNIKKCIDYINKLAPLHITIIYLLLYVSITAYCSEGFAAFNITNNSEASIALEYTAYNGSESSTGIFYLGFNETVLIPVTGFNHKYIKLSTGQTKSCGAKIYLPIVS